MMEDVSDAGKSWQGKRDVKRSLFKASGENLAPSGGFSDLVDASMMKRRQRPPHQRAATAGI